MQVRFFNPGKKCYNYVVYRNGEGGLGGGALSRSSTLLIACVARAKEKEKGGGGGERKTVEGGWGGGLKLKLKLSPLNPLPLTFQNCVKIASSVVDFSFMTERIIFRLSMRLGQKKTFMEHFRILFEQPCKNSSLRCGRKMHPLQFVEQLGNTEQKHRELLHLACVQ